MVLDVAGLRRQFPSLESGIAHFDGPGGTQTPRPVGEAVARTLTGPLSNRGGLLASERNADEAVTGFRSAFADLLGTDPRGIVHGRSATQLTYDLSRALARTWQPGDEVVVTRLDHDANVSPWLQAAAAAGVGVRWIDVDPGIAELDWGSVVSAVDGRTRLVALTAASNLLGTIPPVRRVADLAHEAGAVVYVDAVHLAAHRLVDAAALGADAVVCSPYKLLGPHCGVLGADPALLESLAPDKLAPSTDAVPERFELGTLPYEVLAGATAAVDFLAALEPGGGSGRRERLAGSLAAVHEHEHRLLQVLEDGLAELGGRVVVHSRAAERTPTLLLTFPGRSGRAVSEALAERGVLAPAGYFYAHQASLRLGLDDDAPVRVGLAPYTDDEDVARLLAGIGDALSG